MNTTIRQATINDLNALQNISQQTFTETYASFNTAENMQQYLSTVFSLENLAAEINNPNTSFYFAVTNDSVTGYLKLNFNTVPTSLKNSNAVEVERIYVVKAMQGKKLGQLLLNKAIAIAQEKNTAVLWLGVWEKNTNAIQFYTKNGLVPFGTHIFMLGNDEQTDILMQLPIANT